jgi:hypothetical protein
MTAAEQLPPQLLVVVDLAVLNDRHAVLLARDRLVAGLEVDDREPPSREADRAVDVRPVRVGPAMDERRAHGGESAGVDGAAGGRDSADPAHASLL